MPYFRAIADEISKPLFGDGDEVRVERTRVVHVPTGKFAPRVEAGAHFPAVTWQLRQPRDRGSAQELPACAAPLPDREICPKGVSHARDRFYHGIVCVSHT